jgi:hypothetical protein
VKNRFIIGGGRSKKEIDSNEEKRNRNRERIRMIIKKR